MKYCFIKENLCYLQYNDFFFRLRKKALLDLALNIFRQLIDLRKESKHKRTYVRHVRAFVGKLENSPIPISSTHLQALSLYTCMCERS